MLHSANSANQPILKCNHLVLERAGLISRGREAQWRPCKLEAAPLKGAAEWVEQYRAFWAARLDRLENYLQQLQAKEKKHGRKK